MIANPEPPTQAIPVQATPCSQAIDTTAAEEMLRTLHENLTDDPSTIGRLIHPEAEMRLLVSYGQPLRGRAAIVKALERGREATLYRATVTRFEWLDEHTSLTSAQARYALRQGGFAEGAVYWLDELQGGLIWRVHVFRDETRAREAFEGRAGQDSAHSERRQQPLAHVAAR